MASRLFAGVSAVLRGIAIVSVLFLVAGCIAFMPPPEPSRNVQFGALLTEDGFDTPSAWDDYDLQGAFLRVLDGSYHIRTSLNNYVYGENRQVHDNAIVEVEAYLLSDYPKAMYGLSCRHSRNGGYYFVISGNGNFSIRRISQNHDEALVKWQASSAIHTGRRNNVLRAVCDGDYLAFYINGQFAGEATDTVYSSGVTALTAAIPAGETNSESIEVMFDNVRVWSMP